jgi:hypothetical protein
MAHPARNLLDRHPAFHSRFHDLCIAGFYIGMAMLASSLLEAYGVWQTIAEMLGR